MERLKRLIDDFKDVIEIVNMTLKYPRMKVFVDESLDLMKRQEKEIATLKAENERLKGYRTGMPVKPNEDGEYWCPKCHEQIAGYYASYCEYCGQSVELEESTCGE